MGRVEAPIVDSQNTSIHSQQSKSTGFDTNAVVSTVGPSFAAFQLIQRYFGISQNEWRVCRSLAGLVLVALTNATHDPLNT
jgi:hypothetical protein